jgi:hypothetical protein
LAYQSAVSSLWSWSPGAAATKHLDFPTPTCDVDATLQTLVGWSSSGGCTLTELTDLKFWTASTETPSALRWSDPVAMPYPIRIVELVASDEWAAAMVIKTDDNQRPRIWLINLSDFSIRDIPLREGQTRRVRLALTPRYLYTGDIDGPQALSSITHVYRYDMEQREAWSVPLQ